ncbi:protein extra-macrochaetae-like [Amphibalanus amphitrite]|uniref:protein extra-macrochaetae-like n=1 Tax=Amphibalanus amphitrite TaxID=1232801 RepID=UPI001C9288E3|nr:protein extra-macrochaetae-like [Amphibalanus amphitrite]
MKTEMKPGRQPPAVFQQSRRLRRPRSGDTERVRALLNRLQHIVPAAPKDRQLPQVQVIQHVINYICQLQHQVVRHPRLGKMVAVGKEGEKLPVRLTEEGRRKEGGEREEAMEAETEARREPAGETEETLQVSSEPSSTSPDDSDEPSPE